MDTEIKKLDNNVSLRLRSDIHITSFGRAVCELLQNSVDAGATSINIKLDLEGYNVCIHDNGSGILPSCLMNLGRRYFTSKIRDLDDLARIKTFGFRGEALHSLLNVASVNVFTRSSKSSKIFAVKLGSTNNCIFKLEKDCGHNDLHKEYEMNLEAIDPKGTVVILTDFLKNNPVRRRIIQNSPRSDILEDIMEYIVHSLVRLPPVKVSLEVLDQKIGSFRQKKLIDMRIYMNKTVQERYSMMLKSVFGSSFNDFDSISAVISGFELNGVIGKRPCLSQRYQYIYINCWPMVIPSYAKSNICKIFSNSGFELEMPNFAIPKSNLSPKKKLSSPPKASKLTKFPVFLINIQCEDIVDELIQDPSKCIFKTRHWFLIEKMLYTTFEKFLNSRGLEANESLNRLEQSPKRRAIQRSDQHILTKRREEMLPSEENSDDRLFQLPNLSHNSVESDFFTKIYDHTISKEDFSRCRIVRQIDNKFILLVLTSYQKGILSPTLLLVDQHACDERIKVEELLSEYICQIQNPASKVNSVLSEPFNIPISTFESSLFDRYASNFSLFGITYTLNNDLLKVSHLPQIVIDRASMDLNQLKYGLLEHLYCLHENKKKVNLGLSSSSWFNLSAHLPNFIIDIINRQACRSSIMFGDKLGPDEMQFLINRLGTCNLPFQCAHGRPVILPLVSTNDISYPTITTPSEV